MCKSPQGSSLNYSKIFEHSEKLYFVDDVHKLLILPIPKAGCTSWKMTLLNSSRLSGPHLQNVTVHNKDIFREHGFRIFKELAMEEKTDIFESYYKILSVRHPFDRLESAYIDKIVQYTKDPQYKIYLLNFKYGIGNYSKDISLSNLTFEDFLNGVMGYPERHWDSYQKTAFPCVANLRYVDCKKLKA